MKHYSSNFVRLKEGNNQDHEVKYITVQTSTEIHIKVTKQYRNDFFNIFSICRFK